MKIERINENQIRCTLTSEDLSARHLKLSELAFGTENAKSLFRDLMQEASNRFGFETDNLPLMIEAIPSSPDSIILNVTKVNHPEELEARFPKLASDGDLDLFHSASKLEGAHSFLDFLGKLKEKYLSSQEVKTTEELDSGNPETDAEKEEDIRIRLFSFANLDHIIEAAKLLDGMYDGMNTLYKDTAEDVYVLAMHRSAHTPHEFSRICNITTEYGTLEPANGITLAFLEEHCEKILPEFALQELAAI